MRHFALFLVALLGSFALVGCMEPPPPCMSTSERGTVVSTLIDSEPKFCGRGANYCGENRYTSIVVAINGASRVCRIDETVGAALQPGTVVNLSGAARQF